VAENINTNIQLCFHTSWIISKCSVKIILHTNLWHSVRIVISIDVFKFGVDTF